MHILTCGVVPTGRADTLVNVLITVSGSEPRVTRTGVVTNQGGAVAMETRISGGAVVDEGGAVDTSVTMVTLTPVAIDLISTGAHIVTRIRGAVIDVLITELTSEANMALTAEGGVPFNAVPIATTPDTATIGTELDVYRAGLTCPAWIAATEEGAHSVFTDSINTRRALTFINGLVTQGPSEALSTHTGESSHVGHAGRAFTTRRGVTWVNGDVTQRPCDSRVTATGERARSVNARASI